MGYWISEPITTYPAIAASGPVVHSSLTGGLDPGPTTTKQPVSVVSNPVRFGMPGVTLPFLGSIKPSPTEQPSPSQTDSSGDGGNPEQPISAGGSQPVVVLPITQSQDPSQDGSASPSPEITTPPVQITVGSHTYTANPSSRFVIGTQTLEAGGPAITHDGHTISLRPSASDIIVDSSTVSIVYPPIITFAPNDAPVLTINSHPVTANSDSEYVIDSQTLVPGSPAITISGSRVSLAPSATNVVVGTSTEPLGSIIMSGFGPSTIAGSTGRVNSSTTGAVAFTGGAGLGNRSGSWGAVMIGITFALTMS